MEARSKKNKKPKHKNESNGIAEHKTQEVEEEMKVFGVIKGRIDRLENWLSNTTIRIKKTRSKNKEQQNSESFPAYSLDQIDNRPLPFLPTVDSVKQTIGFNFKNFQRKEGFYIPSFVCIMTLAFLVFVNGLNGGLVFDDAVAIGKNPDIRPEQTGWGSMWFNDYWGNPINTPGVWTCKSYRPLTVLTFRMNYMIHNTSTLGYHLGNVLVHCIVTYLFYLIGQVIFVQYKQQKRQIISFVSAIVFAIHPIHTDAVDSIVGRAEVMYAMFFCLSFLLYSKSSRCDKTHWISFIGSLLCFAASCLSKEMGIMVLGLNIGWDLLYNYNFITVGIKFITMFTSYFSNNNAKSFKQASKEAFGLISKNWIHFIIRLALMLFCAFLYLLHRSIYVGGLAGINMQKHHNPIAFSLGWDRWRTIFYLHYLYAYLLFVPVYLSADYSMACIPIITEWFNIYNLYSALFYCSVIGTIIYVIIKGGKFHKAALLVLAWYIIPFLPASQVFFSPGTMLAERVLYVPSCSFCFFVGWLLYTIFKHDIFKPNRAKKSKNNTLRDGKTSTTKERKWKKIIFYSLIISVGAFYIGKTVSQNTVWESQYELFKNAAHTCPTSGKSLYNYGAQLETRGLEEEALQLYLNASIIDPSYTNALGRIGKIYLKRGRIADSVSYFQQIVNHTFADGGLLHHEFAYHDIAYAYWQLKNYSAAEKFFKIALRVKPEADYRYPVDTLNNLGCLYLELGYIKHALEFFLEAEKERSNDPMILNNKGVVFWKMNKTQEAVQLLRTAAELSQSSKSIPSTNWQSAVKLLNGEIKSIELKYNTVIRP